MSDPWGKSKGGAWGADPGGFEDILGQLGGGKGGAAGLDGLIDQLRGAGLGPQLDSWIGTGSNAQVDPDDMRRSFGDERLEALGSRMGVGGGALAAILAQLLPLLIDRLSPQGRMPQQDDRESGGGGLGSILGGILGGGGLGSILGGILGGGGGGTAAQGPGEEVEPPPERAQRRSGKPQADAGGWPGKGAATDDQAPYPGKPGYPGKGAAAPYPGKPGWPQQAPAEPSEESGDVLGDLARSVDRLRRR